MRQAAAGHGQGRRPLLRRGLQAESLRSQASGVTAVAWVVAIAAALWTEHCWYRDRRGDDGR
jgi:hypothetical protein